MQLKNIAIVLVSGLVFAGCSLLPGSADDVSDDSMMNEAPVEETMMKDSDSMMEETTLDEDEAMMEDDSMMTDGKNVKLVAENFTFGTDEIRVKKGEPLKVLVMNKQGMHDLVIDELGVNSGMIPEGETMEIEIPTDTAGTFEYYCSVGEHRANGMVGTLIIE